MSATVFSASFGAIAGADLEAELKQLHAVEDNTAQADDSAHVHAHAVRERASGAAARVASQAAVADSARLRERRDADIAVELRGVRKQYGERTVLADFDLSIERGSFVAIVGRSGCGKSTLLRLVAGLETPTAGVVDKHAGGARARDKQRDEPNAQRFDTRIMFQDARLLPWKTVLQNVMLGLGRGAREDARAVLAEVGLAERANDWPAQLSGGQRQRVALARALVHRPQLMLLDEPLGALDALTRIEMHMLIERLWREHRFTALLVTHDVHEAVALADRILLIEAGHIALDQQVPLARPRERASAGFAALEAQVLQRVLASGDGQHKGGQPARAEPDVPRLVRPTDVRWAL
jgi:sulfonate transport system ATP-binding protein